ncbi:DUF5597 domain-containing protein [Spirosoma sp. BT702]|uniref:DUF5597 domain-containing protein n=1 Tax=Spirosoma profusum TaxID=2771354 RepID=A0A927AVE0_9BACT|nr:DUF5597 domain-containing protein [Spirosoma profusum]MBD2705133.1 DUF5597 domain-containing protein [Spirosoma profusum]
MASGGARNYQKAQGVETANLTFWIYGQHDAMGVAPFGIDATSAEQDPFAKTFAALAQVQDLILQYQGKGTMAGIFVDTTSKSQTVTLNGYTVKADLVVPRRFPGATLAGGLVFGIGPDEFLAVGKDYELTFTPVKHDSQQSHVDVAYMDEGNFVGGKWITIRRLNGDEGTGGGSIGSFAIKNNRTGTLRFQKNAGDNYSIVRIKFYHY